MLSLQFVRENPDLVRDALDKRHDTAPIDDILSLDRQRRNVLTEAETLRARRNEVSKQIGKTGEKPPQLIEEMRQIGDTIKLLDEEVKSIEEELSSLLLRVPNIPDASVPVGKDENDNTTVRSWGEARQFDFQPLPHWELGEKLGIIDFERGVKLSGSRFYVLKGQGAHLQRALISFMLDLHIEEHGYTEVYPPFMVKRECMIGSGNLISGWCPPLRCRSPIFTAMKSFRLTACRSTTWPTPPASAARRCRPARIQEG
jgi:seryl-tRNA synthetase